MKGYKKVRGMNRVLEQLIPLAKPGATVVEVQHNDWCAIFRTGRFEDCNCEPDILAVRPFEKPKNGGQA